MLRGELAEITWDQVNLEENKITLDAENTITSESRITGELYHAIAYQLELHKQKYPSCQQVFSLDGYKIKYCRKSWLTACKNTRLDGKLFYDLRRSGGPKHEKKRDT